jgi:hypothetical protein
MEPQESTEVDAVLREYAAGVKSVRLSAAPLSVRLTS